MYRRRSSRFVRRSSRRACSSFGLCPSRPTLTQGTSILLGFLNLFKPAGPTSTQFGARLRHMYPTEDGSKLAVGHLGTLDPQAAGVLPVALGRATRLLPLIEDRRKAYAFTLVLGRATDTADGVGAVTATAPLPEDVDRRLDAAVRSFI